MSKPVQAPAGLVYRGHVPYFRLRIPQHLQSHFGAKEVKQSLGRATSHEQAKAEARRLSVEWEAKFSEAQQRIAARNAPPPVSLSSPERSRYCEAWLAYWLQQDEAQRRAATISEDEHADSIEVGRDLLLEARNRLARGDISSTRSTLDDVFDTLPLPLPVDEEQRRRLAFDLLPYEVRLYELIAQRDRGEIVPAPAAAPLSTAPISSPAAGPRSASHAGERLSAVVDLWQRVKKPKAATVAACRRVVREFEALHGELSPAEVRKDHFIELRNLRASEGVSGSTIRKDFNLIGAAFEQAASDGALGVTVNPLKGVKVTDTESGKKPREAFSVEELRALFALPVFVAGVRPKGGAGEAAFWLPLLALFTGARRGELAQLRADDIEERDGVRCIVLRHDAARGQQIKTGSGGARRVPIHAELERLGFLRYADAIRKRGGEGWLFPLLDHDKQSPDRAKAWGKWFGRLLDEAGLSDARLDFHAFRHTFKHHARASGIAEDQQDAITGHAGGNAVARGYGSKQGYPLPRLAVAVARFEVEGLDLSNLKGA